jgi:hypothetical protein
VPCAQAGEKFRRPLVSGFKNDPLPDFPDNHLVLILSKTTGLWQTHGLTASIPEDSRSFSHAKKYICKYILIKALPRSPTSFGGEPAVRAVR